MDLEKLNIVKMTKKKGISKPREQRPQGWCVWSAGEHGETSEAVPGAWRRAGKEPSAGLRLEFIF